MLSLSKETEVPCGTSSDLVDSEQQVPQVHDWASRRRIDSGGDPSLHGWAILPHLVHNVLRPSVGGSCGFVGHIDASTGGGRKNEALDRLSGHVRFQHLPFFVVEFDAVDHHLARLSPSVGGRLVYAQYGQAIPI